MMGHGSANAGLAMQARKPSKELKCAGDEGE